MAAYDVLRLFRLMIRHGTWWLELEDFGYWIGCTILVFRMLFYANNGVLRGYVILFVFAGMLLYDRIVSRSLFAVLKKLGRWITMRKRHVRLRKEMRKHGTEP